MATTMKTRRWRPSGQRISRTACHEFPLRPKIRLLFPIACAAMERSKSSSRGAERSAGSRHVVDQEHAQSGRAGCGFEGATNVGLALCRVRTDLGCRLPHSLEESRFERQAKRGANAVGEQFGAVGHRDVLAEFHDADARESWL